MCQVPVATILNFILDETCYLEYLRRTSFADHTVKWRNLGELTHLAQTRRELVETEFTLSQEYVCVYHFK